MKDHRLWLVVADGSRARILSRQAANQPLGEIEMLDSAKARLPSREIASDGPGRSFDSGGKGRHATNAPADPHQQEKIAFLDDLAARINAAVAKDEVGELVLVAAPHALGRLREKLDKQATQRIAAYASKDLTEHSLAELDAQLREMVGPWDK